MKTIFRFFIAIAWASLAAQTPREAIQRNIGTNTIVGTSTSVPAQVATIAALKATSVTNIANGQQVFVVGYASNGDGGGGNFYYASGSSATDNGGTIIQPTSGSGRWLRSVVGPVDVRWFGAVADGSTDASSAIQAAITYLTGSAGDGPGGTLFFPAGTFRIESQLTFGNDGGTPPRQPALKLVGAGCLMSGQGTAPLGGTILDMRSTTSPAKVDTRGLGAMEITGITFACLGGSDTNPFIQTTNTTLLMHDVGFYGRLSGSAAIQDAIVLGGTTTNIDGSATAAFQGYGTTITRCYFSRVRRAVYGRVYANANTVTQNTVWSNCGFPTGAPFDFDGLSPSGNATGNVIAFNLVEITNYAYAYRFGYSAANQLVFNNTYDTTAGVVSYYFCGTGASGNIILDGFHDTTKPTYTETTASSTAIYTNLASENNTVGLGGTYTIRAADIVQSSGFNSATKNAHLIAGSNEFWLSPRGTGLAPIYALALKDNVGNSQDAIAAKMYGVAQNALIIYGSAFAGLEAPDGDLKIRVASGSSLFIGDTTGQALTYTQSSKLLRNTGRSLLGGSNSTGEGVLEVRGASGQTAALADFTNNSGTPKVSVYADGTIRGGGTGTPESVVTAPVGSMFLRSDGGAGTTLYVKESGTGNTGWVGK